MKILKKIEDVKGFTTGSTVAIGNFDGVHLGHRRIIANAKKLAYPNRVGIITFEPHPRDYFVKNSKPFKLIENKEKYSLLEELGLDFAIELEFNHQLENYSPEQFISIILAKKLEIRNVMVGQDFRFGHKRSGDFKKLKELGKTHGLNAYAVELFSKEKQTISSTRIRTALEHGKTQEAKDMLGYWHKIYGQVTRGDRRGRELGYPTANIALKGVLIPKHGIYSCLIKVLSGKFTGLYQGAASIGTKPTFGEHEANLEVHIFNFSHEIYGQEVAISLLNFQRPEEKFESIESLIEQMKLDCEQARSYLSSISLSA